MIKGISYPLDGIWNWEQNHLGSKNVPKQIHQDAAIVQEMGEGAPGV